MGWGRQILWPKVDFLENAVYLTPWYKSTGGSPAPPPPVVPPPPPPVVPPPVVPPPPPPTAGACTVTVTMGNPWQDGQGFANTVNLARAHPCGSAALPAACLDACDLSCHSAPPRSRARTGGCASAADPPANVGRTAAQGAARAGAPGAHRAWACQREAHSNNSSPNPHSLHYSQHSGD